MSRPLVLAVVAAFLTPLALDGKVADPLPAAAGLPVGRWQVEFANGVTQACEVREDGTASVEEPRRTAGGKAAVRGSATVIVYDDDRVERWTPVGKKVVVEHWYPGSALPAVTAVLGIAERVP